MNTYGSPFNTLIQGGSEGDTTSHDNMVDVDLTKTKKYKGNGALEIGE